MPDPSSTTATTDREFTITRVFDAPRQLVWKAWTDPEHLARWWGPHDFTTPLSTISMDVRPGGRLRATMIADADRTQYPFEMVYREVVEPERLVLAWGDPRHPVAPQGAAVATVTFTDLGDKTEMRFHQAGINTDEGHTNANAGWSQSFERLAESLARA